MKRFIRIPAIIATCLLLISTTFAGEEDNLRILKYPAFTEAELKQIPFNASLPANMNPNGVYVSLHNPIRDKIIVGIVVEVSYKKASAEKPTVLNLFIRMSCGPLQSAFGAEQSFEADEARKAGAVITLKEVHYYSPEPSKTE